jgi:hypothetical protein
MTATILASPAQPLNLPSLAVGTGIPERVLKAAITRGELASVNSHEEGYCVSLATLQAWLQSKQVPAAPSS